MIKFALTVSLLLSTPSCAWLQTHPKISAALECTTKEILASIPSVLADVAQALSGTSPDWSALAKLEESKGLDVVICAANKLTSPPPGASANTALVKNAQTYIKSRVVAGAELNTNIDVAKGW